MKKLMLLNISTFAMKKTEEVKDAQGEIRQESYEGIDYVDYLFK